MNGFQDWLSGEVDRIGWSELLRRAKGRFTSGALQAWLHGSFPAPSYQVVLAEITGVSIDTIKDLVWQAELTRAARRRRPGSSSSVYSNLRLPLAKVGLVAEVAMPTGVLIPAAAARLERAAAGRR